MFKIELVEQTTKFNCGAAALVMILGLPSAEHVERDHMKRDCSTSHADRSNHERTDRRFHGGSAANPI